MKKILGRILIVVPAIFLQITWRFFVLKLLNDIFSGHLGKKRAFFTFFSIVENFKNFEILDV